MQELGLTDARVAEALQIPGKRLDGWKSSGEAPRGIGDELRRIARGASTSRVLGV